MKIATRLTDAGRLSFIEWVKSVGQTRVIPQVCLDECEEYLSCGDAVYELRGVYTKSGNTEIWESLDADIVSEDIEA